MSLDSNLWESPAGHFRDCDFYCVEKRVTRGFLTGKTQSTSCFRRTSEVAGLSAIGATANGGLDKCWEKHRQQ